MLLPSENSHHTSLLMIEGGLTLIAVAASFAWPRLCSSWFARVERAFSRLARRQGLAVLTVGFSTLLLRLAMLPVIPVPLPFCVDDFSFLLAADTFVHGRLTNPTPALWPFFESIQLTVWPTYQTMYFPGHGLVLAAGQVLFGNPWFAILCVDALFCAALCWMLQAWLSRPRGALLGGLLAVLRLGLFSYWINTYTGGGTLLALGGALVLGALPRLTRTARMRYGILMALGIAIVALTRPYEGLLLCLPVGLALGYWILKGKNRPRPVVLMRRAALPLAIVVAAVAWLGYYDYRAFGKPHHPPLHRRSRRTTPWPLTYIWQSARPEPAYRQPGSAQLSMPAIELTAYRQIHTWSGFPLWTLVKAVRGVFVFCRLRPAPAPGHVSPRVPRSPHPLSGFVLLVLIAGMVIEIFLLAHYLRRLHRCLLCARIAGHAPSAGLERQTSSPWAVQWSGFPLCFACCSPPCGSSPRPFTSRWTSGRPRRGAANWVGPGISASQRAQIEARLEQLPGKQLVIVRYLPGHEVRSTSGSTTSADIDGSKVVWARDMGAADNLEVLHTTGTASMAGRAGYHPGEPCSVSRCLRRPPPRTERTIDSGRSLKHD